MLENTRYTIPLTKNITYKKTTNTKQIQNIYKSLEIPLTPLNMGPWARARAQLESQRRAGAETRSGRR